jgi:hypothetical protein
MPERLAKAESAANGESDAFDDPSVAVAGVLTERGVLWVDFEVEDADVDLRLPVADLLAVFDDTAEG